MPSGFNVTATSLPVSMAREYAAYAPHFHLPVQSRCEDLRHVRRRVGTLAASPLAAATWSQRLLYQHKVTTHFGGTAGEEYAGTNPQRGLLSAKLIAGVSSVHCHAKVVVYAPVGSLGMRV